MTALVKVVIAVVIIVAVDIIVNSSCYYSLIALDIIVTITSTAIKHIHLHKGCHSNARIPKHPPTLPLINKTFWQNSDATITLSHQSHLHII